MTNRNRHSTNGKRASDPVAQEIGSEELSVDDTDRLLTEMDEPSLWDWEHAEVGPGFYRAPTVARQLAEAVRAYRTEHHLTQEQLGRSLSLHQSQVARIESGQHTPEIETLVRLAHHLCLTFTVQVGPTGASLSLTTMPASAGEAVAG